MDICGVVGMRPADENGVGYACGTAGADTTVGADETDDADGADGADGADDVDGLCGVLGSPRRGRVRRCCSPASSGGDRLPPVEF
jgi:hypothetical protein